MISFLTQDYELFCRQLLFCGDKVTKIITNFMQYADYFDLFVTGMKYADSICKESLLINWLPICCSGDKKHNTTLALKNMEILYEEMNSSDLEGMIKTDMLKVFKPVI